MAHQNKRLPSNVAGNFYVDSTCINCDACRQLASDSFEEIGDHSAVTMQPHGEEQLHGAYQALLACPVGSVGTVLSDRTRMQAAMASIPLRLEDDVHYCGVNPDKSFAANRLLVQHPAVNWLIDSPRYIKHVVDAFDRMGDIR